MPSTSMSLTEYTEALLDRLAPYLSDLYANYPQEQWQTLCDELYRIIWSIRQDRTEFALHPHVVELYGLLRTHAPNILEGLGSPPAPKLQMEEPRSPFESARSGDTVDLQGHADTLLAHLHSYGGGPRRAAREAPAAHPVEPPRSDSIESIGGDVVEPAPPDTVGTDEPESTTAGEPPTPTPAPDGGGLESTRGTIDFPTTATPAPPPVQPPPVSVDPPEPEMAFPEPEIALPPEDDESKKCALNAGFFFDTPQVPLPTSADDAQRYFVPASQPLALDGGPYRLGANVGRPWGLYVPEDNAYTISEFIDPVYLAREVETLTLEVAVRGPIVAGQTQTQPLEVPREGNSPMVYFDIELSETGRQTVEVDIFFEGNLLQTRHLEALVVAEAGAPVPDDQQPAQSGRITFSRVSEMGADNIDQLKERPRRLTIVASLDPATQDLHLTFYDNSGAKLAAFPSEVSAQNLRGVLKSTRGALEDAVNAYKNKIDPDAGTARNEEKNKALLREHLGKLASIGRSFYFELLPRLADDWGQTQPLNLDLQPRQVIQVAPLSDQVGVPWELLYEWPIESYSDDIKLCQTFREHGLDEPCPHRDDELVVCPYGFWGYRYIIEQLPSRIPADEPPPAADLPREVLNDVPLRFLPIVYTTFPSLTKHLERLQKLTQQLQFQISQQVASRDGMRSLFKNPDALPDVLYFYTHGKVEDGQPAIIYGQGLGEKLKKNDLTSWRLDLRARQPLVVLNACDSASYTPDQFENLIQLFCQRGAAGVIGTQCSVVEDLADVFVRLFLDGFFARGLTAGEAMLDARHALLNQYIDPRGLAYSLFATADVTLDRPIAPALG